MRAPTAAVFEPALSTSKREVVADLSPSSASPALREQLEGVSAVEGFYSAPVGSLLNWRFDYATSYRLETVQGGEDEVVASSNEAVTIPFRGDLHMQVLSRDAEVTTVLVQGTDTTVVVGGPSNARGEDSLQLLRDAFEQWFLVRIDERGAVQSYAFQEGRTPRQRNFARAILAGFFHTIPTTPVSTWDATEFDASGEYNADYQLAIDSEWAAVVVRTKREYTKIGMEAELPKHSLSGRSVAHFGSHLGWLHSVSIDERMVMDITEFPSRVHVATKAKFEHINHNWRGVDVDPSEWPEFVSGSGANEDLATGSICDERDQWRDKTEQTSLEELLAQIQIMVEAGDTRGAEFYETWQMLHWKLALDSDAVEAASQLLLSGGLTEETGSMLLSALGKAGSPESQDALLAVYGESALGEGWRESAAVSMFQLVTPSTKVVQTLTSKILSRHEFNQLDATSMLLLGTLAPRQDATLENGVTALASLLSLESRARETGSLGLWLDALGNAAVPEIAPYASRYLRHENALVRESAVAALDRSAATGIDAQLITAAVEDLARPVRLRAIEALGNRESRGARLALQDLALNSKDTGMRRAAIEAMASRDKLSGKDRSVLMQVARQDSDDDLRNAARQLAEA